MNKLKKYGIWIFYGLEFIFSLIAFILILTMGKIVEGGIEMSQNLSYICGFFLAFSLIFCFAEYVYDVSLLKIFVMFTCLFVAMLPLINKNFLFLNLIFSFSAPIFMIIIVVNAFLYQRKIKKPKTLPVGYVSLTNLKQNKLFFAIVVINLILLYEVLSQVYELNIFLIILSFIIIGGCVGFISLMLNPFNKLVNNFQSTCDFEAFEKQVNEYLQNNLHPDTKIYLNLIKVNYLLAIDREEGFKLFESLDQLTTKAYINFYKLITLIYYQYKKDYGRVEELLADPSYRRLGNKKTIIAMRNKVFGSLDVIENIEMFYAEKGSKFAILNNQYIKMNYYYKRDNFDMAKTYASRIINNGPTLLEYVKEAKEILNKISQQ